MSQYKTGTVDVNDGAAPASPSATPAAGGSLADDQYFYAVTAFLSAGETVGSAEVDATTSGSNNSVDLSWSAVTGALKYRVYRGVATGVYTDYYEITAPTVTFTDTGAAATSGSPPATSNIAQIVIGVGTLFLANVAAGQRFRRAGDLATYTVASIQTDLKLTLATAYAGVNGTGVNYTITKDFTDKRSYPRLNNNDRDWPGNLDDALVGIDNDMQQALGSDELFGFSTYIRAVGTAITFIEASVSTIQDTVSGTDFEIVRHAGGQIEFQPVPSPRSTHKVRFTNGLAFYDPV